MPRWISVIASGIVSTAFAGFLFWWVNNMHRVNGVGLLQRQPWPINAPWVWGAGGFAVGAVAQFLTGTRRADHARATRALAEELGQEYTASYSLPPDATSMAMFEGWSDGRNAMTGREGGGPVAVFDYTTITPGSETNTVTHRTAALLPVEGLPAFDLHPRTLGRRVLGWAGFEGLTFDPAAAAAADAETVRRFSELFQLFTADPMRLLESLADDSPPEQAGQEEAVRRLFTPSVMQVVTQYRGYAIQSRPGFLAVWRGSGVLPFRKRSELWRAAAALRALLNRPQGEAARVIAGRPGTEPGRQARKLRNTLVGGVVGLFIGFILAAMVTSIVFFRQVRGHGAGLGFFLNPVMFFGFILVGAALGAGIGSRVPVRDSPSRPSEDPMCRKARQRASGIAALVGLFAGFFAGFVAFAVSKLLFHWELDDFGKEGAIFFGSIFGGALLGALVCGTVVNWFHRRQPDNPS